METVRRKTRTPGSVLASQRFDAAIEDGIAERPARYPLGATFVGADLPGLGAILAKKAREGGRWCWFTPTAKSGSSSRVGRRLLLGDGLGVR
jgi:hypothetical protein